METVTALENTLNALTFNEKPLARELFSSRRTAKQSKRVWIRDPVLELSAAISTARDLAKVEGFPARFINLYCDTLTINDDVITAETDADKLEPYLNLEIFARKIVAKSAAANRITFPMSSTSELTLWTPRLSSDLTLRFSLPNAPVKEVNPRVEAGQFGVTYSWSDDGLKVQQEASPDVPLAVFDYLSLVQEDGTLKDLGPVSDNIARLLQFQLLIAQANMEKDRQFALDVLSYIISATDSPFSAALHYQAITLSSSLSLEANVIVVPSVNVYSSKQILEARLASAIAYEDAFRQFSLASVNTEHMNMFAMNLVAKSKDATDTYKIIRSLRQKDYDNAVVSNTRAIATFNKNMAVIDETKKEFDVGVEKYKADKEAEAAKGIIKGIFAAIIAVAAIVATGGAAAPAALPAVAGTISAASKIAALIAKIKETFDKLKAIFEKLKPVIEKIAEVVKMIAEVLKAIQRLEKVTGDPSKLKLGAQSSDPFNVIAEWRNFDITVREMEDSMIEYPIEGKQQYFHALKTLVNNGEALINTQTNLVARGDELATVILQQQMETRDLGRLEKLASKGKISGAVLELLRRAMFDRLLSIRTLVFLDFSTYVGAYQFHSLRRERIVTLSPVKPAGQYLEDAAKLQAAVASYGSTTRIQATTFVFDTLGGYATASDLAYALKTTKRVAFPITAQEDIWTGFDRIRMSSVRCYLKGVSSKAAKTIRLVLKTDGRFFDLETVARAAVDKFSPGSTDPTYVTKAYVGDPRSILFEYAPSTGAIVCDGQYGLQLDFTKHSPMSNWEVELVSPPEQLDLSALEGLRMEFTCEVIWKGARR